MCLILIALFLYLAYAHATVGAWGYATLYGTLALLFLVFLLYNLSAMLRQRGCQTGGCRLLSLFKGTKQQKDDQKLHPKE